MPRKSPLVYTELVSVMIPVFRLHDTGYTKKRIVAAVKRMYEEGNTGWDAALRPGQVARILETPELRTQYLQHIERTDDTPGIRAVRDRAVNLLTEGSTLADIAIQLGTTQGAIRRWIADPEVRDELAHVGAAAREVAMLEMSIAAVPMMHALLLMVEATKKTHQEVTAQVKAAEAYTKLFKIMKDTTTADATDPRTLVQINNVSSVAGGTPVSEQSAHVSNLLEQLVSGGKKGVLEADLNVAPADVEYT